MKKYTWLLLVFVGAPYIVGASIEFLPAWASGPTCLLAVLWWIGACIEIKEYGAEKDKKNETQ